MLPSDRFHKQTSDCCFWLVWCATLKLTDKAERLALRTPFTRSFLNPTPPSLPPSAAKDWAGTQEVDLELSVCELAPCWDGRQKQMTLYLCPCRKCHSGLWLWDRQHAHQKCVCPRALGNNKDRVGLVDRHLRTSLCHHPKGNRSALIVSCVKCNAKSLFTAGYPIIYRSPHVVKFKQKWFLLLLLLQHKYIKTCTNPYIFSSFQQLLCIDLSKWTYYRMNHKNTPPLCSVKGGFCADAESWSSTHRAIHIHITFNLCAC